VDSLLDGPCLALVELDPTGAVVYPSAAPNYFLGVRIFAADGWNNSTETGEPRRSLSDQSP
jgi:hypothetical protein